jgi:hypothetical protein
MGPKSLRTGNQKTLPTAVLALDHVHRLLRTIATR